MQIREIDLKELESVYPVISQLRDLTYKEFEDLIYDMRYMDYKMIGVFEKDKLISYAGVCIQTTLKDRRHLRVFDFISDKDEDVKKYDKILLEYLDDFAKVGMCEQVIF